MMKKLAVLLSLKSRSQDSPMERRRALMIDTRTGTALDPGWQPMLALDELEPANALMRKNHLNYRWQWVPAVAQLSGVAQLGTRA